MTYNLHHVVISQLPKPSEKLWEHVRSISWTITWTHSRHSPGFLQGLKAPMPHLSVFIRVSGYVSAPLSCHAKQSHSLHGRQGWPTPNCDLYPRRRVLSVLFGTRHITAQTNKPIKTKLLQNIKKTDFIRWSSSNRHCSSLTSAPENELPEQLTFARSFVRTENCSLNMP